MTETIEIHDDDEQEDDVPVSYRERKRKLSGMTEYTSVAPTKRITRSSVHQDDGVGGGNDDDDDDDDDDGDDDGDDDAESESAETSEEVIPHRYPQRQTRNAAPAHTVAPFVADDDDDDSGADDERIAQAIAESTQYEAAAAAAAAVETNGRYPLRQRNSANDTTTSNSRRTRLSAAAELTSDDDDEAAIRRSNRTRSEVQRFNPQSGVTRPRGARQNGSNSHRSHRSRSSSSSSFALPRSSGSRRVHYGDTDDSNSSDSTDTEFINKENKRLQRERNAILPLSLSLDPMLQPAINAPSSQKPHRSALADIDPIIVSGEKFDWNSVGGLDGHIRALKEMVQLPLHIPGTLRTILTHTAARSTLLRTAGNGQG